MSIWAIGDLHLSFGCHGKEMDVFGPEWHRHHEKIQAFWDSHVHSDDLVLIPGDISWAMRLDEAKPDLAWIDARPGTKVMIKGNHDHWWASASKVRAMLPPSLHIIWNDAFQWGDVSVGGSRLWETDALDFSAVIEMKPKPPGIKEAEAHNPQDDKKIFDRELLRLEASLKAMRKDAPLKIVMTHFPPIGWDMRESAAVPLIEGVGAHHVVFGHLHSVRRGILLFGTKAGIPYDLVSADWLQFTLFKVS